MAKRLAQVAEPGITPRNFGFRLWSSYCFSVNGREGVMRVVKGRPDLVWGYPRRLCREKLYGKI